VISPFREGCFFERRLASLMKVSVKAVSKVIEELVKSHWFHL
jgi:hypothetical protein